MRLMCPATTAAANECSLHLSWGKDKPVPKLHPPPHALYPGPSPLFMPRTGLLQRARVDLKTCHARVIHPTAPSQLVLLDAGAFQRDRRIRVYRPGHDWELHKEVQCRSLRWTITDAVLSPDQQHLVYASITPTIHLVSPVCTCPS